VLPYREMHNSGSVLAALSLDRPVLVPANEVNELLAAEVGEPWVLMYDDLTTDVIESAFTRIREQPPQGTPDLSRREWSAAGADHLAAFQEALRRRKGRRDAPLPPAADPDNPQS
jgi:beta-1,4-mannosyltransferase